MNGPAASETIAYGPDGPTERELRLIGDIKGKRVLELGCGTGAAAVALAHQGAVVIGIDTEDERLAEARERSDGAEVRVDWHRGDLADLAFLRADSIDLVFSAYALSEVDDAARLFRQVERVLRPNAPFVFSYEHPMSLCIGADGVVTHSPFDRGPIRLQDRLVYVRSVSEVFTDLHRAGLRVDTLLEPRPATRSGTESAAGSGARVPTTIIWRARTEGA